MFELIDSLYYISQKASVYFCHIFNLICDLILIFHLKKKIMGKT